MLTLHDVFSRTREFNRWAHGSRDVKPEEAFMLERYLDPDKSVLEGGTGGARLLRFLQKRGFKSLAGFDFVAELIELNRERDASGEIDFRVLEATSLDYADGS